MNFSVNKKRLIGWLVLTVLVASPMQCLVALNHGVDTPSMKLSNGWQVIQDGTLISPEGQVVPSQMIFGHTAGEGKKNLITDIQKAVADHPEWGSLMSDHEWRELHMHDLIMKCDRTITFLGQSALRRFSIPVLNQAEQSRRVKIIKHLVEDPDLYNSVQQFLQAFQQAEDAFAEYWNPASDVHARAESLYYKKPMFLSKFLNKRKTWLEGTYLFEFLRATGTTLTCIGLMSVIKAYGVYFAVSGFGEQKNISFPERLKSNAAFIWTSFKQGFNFLNFFSSSLYTPGTLGNTTEWTLSSDPQVKMSIPSVDENQVYDFGSAVDVYNVAKDSASSWLPKSLAPLWGVLVSGIRTVGSVQDLSVLLPMLYGQIKNHIVTANELQDSFVKVAHCMRLLHSLEESISENDFDTPLTGIKSFVREYSNGRMAELIKLLTSATFDENSSVVYQRGKVLRAHRIMQEIKEQFIPIFEQIANLDAFYSIATLYKEREGTDAVWSFVELVENDTPILALEDAWTPLIDPDKAVINSVSVGGKEHGNNIVLTGPNGGGKSTMMFTMAHAIALAQSWGIAPARSVKMTRFKKLLTGLDPKADISKGLSSMMAEKMAVDRICSDIAQSAITDHVFVCIDEPMRGTVDVEAAKRAYALGKQVAAHTNCCMIMATHSCIVVPAGVDNQVKIAEVAQPVHLERDTQGAFANYQMGHEEMRAVGRFKRTYKLQPGYARWWFENGDKRSRFIDWLCTPDSMKNDL